MSNTALKTVLSGVMLLLSGCTIAGLGQDPSMNGDARLQAPLPDSVQDLVDVADLIIRGTVIDVTGAGALNFEVFQPTDVPGAPTPTAISAPHISRRTGYDIDIAKVSILVDEVLFERAPVDVSESSVVTMTLTIDYDSYVTPTPGDPDDENDIGWLVRRTIVLPEENDERLFILTREKAAVLDGYYGPLYGAYDILDLDGNDAMLASSPPIAVDVADDPEVADFLIELDAAIQNQ